MALAWIVRDVRATEGSLDLWQYLGATDYRLTDRPTTAHGNRVLLVTYIVAAVAALRSTAAPVVLIVTGIVTFALRLPGVWTIADAPYAEELRERALLGAYVALLAAVALVVVGAAGRRPVPEGGERPAGPGAGAGVTAFLLLLAMALIALAWEIRQAFVLPSSVYPDWFTGGGRVNGPLTEVPPGWGMAVLFVMLLVAAFGAVARAAFARPLGLIAGGFQLLSGVLGVTVVIRYDLYKRFADLPTERQLSMLTSVFLVFAGAAVIIVLARRGVERAPGGSPGPWGGSGPWGVQPPGYPPAAGPGVPPRAPGHPPAPAPGFGPPPSSPPPGP